LRGKRGGFPDTFSRLNNGTGVADLFLGGWFGTTTAKATAGPSTSLRMTILLGCLGRQAQLIPPG
jgi:hypothetical protein